MFKPRLNEQAYAAVSFTDREAGTTCYPQLVDFSYGNLSKNIALGMAIVLTVLFIVIPPNATIGLLLCSAVAIVVLATALKGRWHFYALTMRGMFFCKSQDAAEHAGGSGLTGMSQTGVMVGRH